MAEYQKKATNCLPYCWIILSELNETAEKVKQIAICSQIIISSLEKSRKLDEMKVMWNSTKKDREKKKS